MDACKVLRDPWGREAALSWQGIFSWVLFALAAARVKFIQRFVGD